MAKITPLYAEHQKCGAQLVDFFGWMLPLNYGSQLKEHEIVRHAVGMFDVSHMHIVDITSRDAENFLKVLLANDVRKLAAPGRALYTCMLSENGGILDDLIVYRRADGYRLVLNAATQKRDWEWLLEKSQLFEVKLVSRTDLAIIALQGPKARALIEKLAGLKAAALSAFQFIEMGESLLACTGYTGEDGYEWILPAAQAPEIWQKCQALGAEPCGLGARDTLRLEAGLNLYGHEMTELVHPFESNVGWTVSLKDPERDFIGRAALLSLRESGIKRALVGVLLKDKGVLRQGQEVYSGDRCVGVTTSGSFSPTLQRGLAMARIEKGVSLPLTVVVRGKQLPVEVVSLPFVKQGKQVYQVVEEV